jgi:hypothetical protein
LSLCTFHTHWDIYHSGPTYLVVNCSFTQYSVYKFFPVSIGLLLFHHSLCSLTIENKTNEHLRQKSPTTTLRATVIRPTYPQCRNISLRWLVKRIEGGRIPLERRNNRPVAAGDPFQGNGYELIGVKWLNWIGGKWQLARYCLGGRINVQL